MIRNSLPAFCVVLLMVGCDPINYISVSRVVPAPLPESCVVQALRSAEQVRAVGEYEEGLIYAELLIPDDMETPLWRDGARPRFGVKEEINEDGERELEFYMLWIGSKGSAYYRDWAEKTMRELQNRVVGSCTRPGSPPLSRGRTGPSAYRASKHPSSPQVPFAGLIGERRARAGEYVIVVMT